MAASQYQKMHKRLISECERGVHLQLRAKALDASVEKMNAAKTQLSRQLEQLTKAAVRSARHWLSSRCFLLTRGAPRHGVVLVFCWCWCCVEQDVAGADDAPVTLVAGSTVQNQYAVLWW